MSADQRKGWLIPHEERLDIAGWFAARAPSVDRCQVSAQEGLGMLAERGLLAKGVPQALGGDGGTLAEMAEVIATVAGSCLTSAFVLWCHRMFVEYVVTSGNPYLIEQVLPELLRLQRFGATGLANAMKHAAFLEELRVSARRFAKGYVLSGKLPWVSNLVDRRFVVAVAARTLAGAGEGFGERIMLFAVPGDAQGVLSGPRFPLFGLEGTASASLVLDEVALDTRWVISHDGGAFLAKVRPVFLVLQSALAWGLAESALESAAAKAMGPRLVLKAEVARLARALDRLVGELRTLAQETSRWERPEMYRALKVRKELAELAVQAAWLELETAGGAGYLSDSDTARRLREAAFFPVQSPSLAQLRLELAQYEKDQAIEAGAHLSGGGDAL